MATAKNSGSPKSKKSKNSKKSNQGLYIKILSAALAVITLCFFAYFLTTSNEKSTKQPVKIEKKDGTQKTIDDINSYLQKQDKSGEALKPRPQEKLVLPPVSEQNSTKIISKRATKIATKEQTSTENNQTKIQAKDENLSKKASEITNKIKDLNLTKIEPKGVTEQNQTAVKQPEINATKPKQSEILPQKIEQNETEILKPEPKKSEKIEQKKAEKQAKSEPKQPNQKPVAKGKISHHESEIYATGAKLVLIIDDVATYAHAQAIKSTGLKITPSIFPATKHHPDTPKIAKMFNFYMIHLPMQAISSGGEEIGTLKVNDSSEKIQKTLQSIKRDFPGIKYMNNHTGSRFTSDFDAMDRFMAVAKAESIVFMDSKTIGSTRVYEAAKKHGLRYIARDVFLDHDSSKAAVTAQLKNAVKIAKQRGYAIAIGHPYKTTIEVLKNAKEILNGVEIVYLREIL